MDHVYTISFENQAITTALDLFGIQVQDNKPVQVLGFELDNVGGTADAGDAEEEYLRLTLLRGFAGLPIGTVPDVVPVDAHDQAASGNVYYVTNTVASGSTYKTVWAGGVSNRIPQPIWFVPGCYPRTYHGDNGMVLRLVAAPNDSIALSGTMWVQEIRP